MLLSQMKRTEQKNNVCDFLMFCIIVILLFCITILETNAFGRYLFLAVSVLAYIVYLVRNDWKISLSFHKLQLYSLLFIIYTFISSFWALNRLDSVSKGITLLEIFFLFYCFYLYFNNLSNLNMLLRAIKLSGFLISVYTLLYYGYNALVYSATSSNYRLQNEFANINNISIVVAVSILIQLWDLQNRRDRLLSAFFIPSFIVVFAFQTRKVFVFIIFGILGLLIVNNLLKKNKLKGLLRLLFSLILFALLLNILSSLPAVRGMFERMNQLAGAENSTIDHSTLVRRELVQAGIEAWQKKPILGIGIGSSHYIAIEKVGMDYYLHNNYIELLSGGGIVGLALYYWYYVFLLVKIFCYRNNNTELFSITFIWLILLLIMDYGMVTYYSKIQWIYLISISVIQKRYFNRRVI